MANGHSLSTLKVFSIQVGHISKAIFSNGICIPVTLALRYPHWIFVQGTQFLKYSNAPFQIASTIDWEINFSFTFQFFHSNPIALVHKSSRRSFITRVPLTHLIPHYNFRTDDIYKAHITERVTHPSLC